MTKPKSRVSAAIAKAKVAAPYREPTPAARTQQERSVRALAVTRETTPDQVVKEFADTKLETARLLDALTSEVTKKLDVFKNVTDALAAATADLESMYGFVKGAGELEDLIRAQEIATAEFDENVKAARAEWKAELDAHEREEKQRDADEEQRRERAKADWQYNFGVECRTLRGTFNERLASEKREWDEERRKAKAQDEERAAALSAREGEMKDVVERIEKIDSELEAVVKMAVNAAVEQTTEKLRNEHALALADLKSTLALEKAASDNLRSINEGLLGANESLMAKYQEATERSCKIAEHAISGAAQRQIIVTSPTGGTEPTDTTTSRRSR